jgi:hypothetical protein
MRLPRLGTALIATIVTTAMSGCQGAALWGNLVVFAVSVGIFCSTLALGRGH